MTEESGFWEYKTVTFGAPPPGEPGQDVTPRLDALGLNGWEAFAYNVYSGTFYLKRAVLPKGDRPVSDMQELDPVKTGNVT
jgi:hypothetical protein